MRYIVDKETNAPAYQQLYMQVRDDIVHGIYPLNTKLPSKRVIADDTGVSTLTVEHAYALLCDEGYITARERSGYFVIFRTDDGFVSPSGKEPRHTITAHPHTDGTEKFPISVLTKTMRKVMSDLGEAILARSPNTGCIELRQEISRYLARSRGIHAGPEQIVVGSGSEYLYGLIVELLGRNRTYGIESPSYKKIQQVYKAADVGFDMLALGHDGIESTALWQCDADVLHVSPYRSFPSGVSASASKRHEYLRWADRQGRYIIEDDFESEFSISKKPEETLFTLGTRDNVIYMNTFSKTISPALRVGYMILPTHLVEGFEDKLGFYSCTVPTYIQYVLAELISNGDFERHINRIRRKKRRMLSSK